MLTRLVLFGTMTILVFIVKGSVMAIEHIVIYFKWIDEANCEPLPKYIYTARAAIGMWDGVEGDDDDAIFYYFDDNPNLSIIGNHGDFDVVGYERKGEMYGRNC